MMPVLGGRLYPGVRETLEELSRNSRLFMVSNCGPDGIRNFLKFTGLGEIMTDHPLRRKRMWKDVNIRTIVERYNPRKPLYVGDVQRDCDESHRQAFGFCPGQAMDSAQTSSEPSLCCVPRKIYLIYIAY